MSKKERFMHASAVFVAALMLLAPLGLVNIFEEGREYENVTSENILGENSFITDYSGKDKIPISKIEINEYGICKTGDTTPLDEGYIITIKNNDELKTFSELVNGDDSACDFSGYTVILTDNIISDADFVPIGNYDVRFRGTFDGQGYIISNLNLNISKENEDVYAGLFGYIGADGIVKNVGIVNSSINVTATSKVDAESTRPAFYCAYAGGIVGSNIGTIENCYSTANITVATKTIDNNESTIIDAYSEACAGGIAGSNTGTIQNCYNTGNVSADECVGGIAGQNYGIIQNCYNTGNVTSDVDAGGITGWNEETIENCYNTGNVTSDGYAGGIVGSNIGTISNCYNTSDMTATASSIASAGGIAGQNYGIIQNCYNTGDMTSDGYAGGIVGRSRGIIQNCYNTGDMTADRYAGGIAGQNYTGTISNCYNTSDMTATASSIASAGGIAGDDYGTNATIQNCYNTGNVTSDVDAGGIIGYNWGIIQNCYNTGNVTSDVYAGGIAGSNIGTIQNCYNTGDMTSEVYAGGITGYNWGTIQNCYNTGDMTSDEYAGGIAGQNYIGAISNCYNTGDVSADEYAGGIVGKNRSDISNTFYANDYGILGTNDGDVEGTIGLAKNEMIDLCLFSEEYNINVDGMWSPDLLGINNGFPVLTNTPLSLTDSEFKSPVYILVGIEEEQVDNFLKLSYTGNSTISAAIMPELQGDFEIKYQWYMYDKESNTFNEIEGAVNNTCTLPNDSSFNKYFVKVTFSNESGESTYASFTRDVQLLEEGHYAIQFNADVVVKDSEGNVVLPSDGTYILENGKYTYSAVVDDKTIKNSFTVSSSDMFVSVEDSTNTLYYAIVVVIVILVLIAAFYFIRKK